LSLDPYIFLILPVIVLSVVVHECAHGWTALACGDPTAKEQGRLTLHPLPHLDPIGSVLLPALLLLLHSPFVLGWAKPIPVDRARLRHPVNDVVWVALAGPASNLLLALAFAALARLAPGEGTFAPLRDVALAGAVLNCALAMFNLIPLPPLDGSWVLTRFLKLRHTLELHRMRWLGLVLIALLFSIRPVANVLFLAPLRFVARACLAPFGFTAAEAGL
jgi:Zn-dependent protease